MRASRQARGMTTRKNCHWSKDEARRVLARAEREGKSITMVAREEGVSPQRLYWWKKRLRGEEPSPSSFVEVRITPPRQAQPFAVQTRNGRSVAVWPGFEAAELARLLAVVEGEGC
jgi:transposase-like protein